MANVLITGGTGLIGSELTKLLISKGYTVTILTRSNKRSEDGVTYAKWRPEKGELDIPSLLSADYIIHLAGAGVADKRWSPQRKKEILESRTVSGNLIASALQSYPNSVKAMVSSSAIGWYGPDQKSQEKRGFTEDAPYNDDFLGVTCKAWEDSVTPARSPDRRLVILRTGIVLSPKGGALREFIKPLKFGVASILGSGDQIISWIHIKDLCRIYLMAIEDNEMNGIYNAVSPTPVTNREFNLELASVMKGSFFLPLHVPTFALKAALGEMSIEVLKSTTVSSRKLQQAGFQFLYPTAGVAIKDLVGTHKSSD